MASQLAPSPWAGARRHPVWLSLFRAVMALACLFCVGTVLAFSPVRFEQHLVLCRQEAPTLARLGLPVGLCAAYLLSASMATLAAYALLAAVVFCRKPDNWFAAFGALHLVSLAAVFTSLNALVPVPPAWEALVTVVRAIGTAVPLSILFLFPDGQLVPRWAWILIAAASLFTLAWALDPSSPLNLYDIRTWPMGLLLGAGWIGIGLLTQVYRYVYVSSPYQRQQTKWVVFATVAFLIILVAAYLPVSFFPSLRQPGFPRLVYTLVRDPALQVSLLFMLICTGLAILRYRLFDIDFLIRRTLIYSVLSAALALVYFGSVVLLQQIFRAVTGQGQNQWVTVLSTLAIAGLFAPLRRRVQDVIDRRFYRRKYNAAKVLAEFAATCRDETDLDKLTARLVDVVQETMQPAHVSLWLKPTADGRRLTAAVTGRPSATADALRNEH